MHLKIIRTKQFLKDTSKLKLTDQHYTKFIIYIGKLLSKEELPPEAKDHQLKGTLKEYRELHISGDVLLIYKIDETQLHLIRLGTHSQLFE
jgi:mRNA interferase YafQ